MRISTRASDRCLLCGATPVEIHHVASQVLDITVPLCTNHHQAITIRQYASGVPSDDGVTRLVYGLGYLAELGLEYGLYPIALSRLILRRAADARIRLR